MTAFQFLATFRRYTVNGTGVDGDISWMLIEANIDGTEPQLYLIMELYGHARYVQNPQPLTFLLPQVSVRSLFENSERCE